MGQTYFSFLLVHIVVTSILYANINIGNPNYSSHSGSLLITLPYLAVYVHPYFSTNAVRTEAKCIAQMFE